MSSPIAILNRLERIFNVVEITEGTFLTTEDGHVIEVRAISANERTYVHPADYPGYDLSTIVFVWCWDDPIDNTQWSDWVPADFLRDLLNEGTLTVTQNTVFDFS